MAKMDEATRKRVRAGRLMLAGKTPAEAANLESCMIGMEAYGSSHH